MQHLSILGRGGTVCAFSLLMFLGSCNAPAPSGADFESCLPAEASSSAPDEEGFVWKTEQFADLKIVRYQIPGWEKLSERQQALVYCLNMAGLSGRDIMYDQNNRYNLRIRRLLEDIYLHYEGDRAVKGWMAFEVYLKRIWFSNGIHHHYANTKHPVSYTHLTLPTILLV